MLKFAHIADVHLGGWRDEKLKILGLKSFTKAVDIIIKDKVDFVVIAGDFFNTAIPNIEVIKHAAFELQRLKDNNIPVFLISGSHDYSPSGKTMLDVLENAKLFVNVQKNASIINGKLKLKFYSFKKKFEDTFFEVKITGIPGKRQALESQFYEILDYDFLEKEEGHKIFLFHMLLEEFKKPEKEKVPSISKSVLPKNFFYYAGGHPHLVGSNDYFNGKIAYPGPLFPNNFEELEELKHGGFYIVKYDGKNAFLDWKKIFLKNVVVLKVDVSNMLSEEITDFLLSKIKNLQLADSIFLLRIEGAFKGKISDIEWNVIRKNVYSRGAYFFSKNIYNLKSDEESFVLQEVYEKDFLEENIIREFEEKKALPEILPNNSLKKLLDVLSEEKKEGETNKDFELRLIENFEKEFNIKLK